jgi:type II secretory pathway pseudopilin PulG
MRAPSSRTSLRAPARGAPARRAFTLSEIVVAIGLLAIVGVVVGTIFASVGDTVTQGREVSNLNRFVARVERTMRRDFENMVRENGFMVIRNETTSLYNGTNPTRLPVALTVTDPAPRPRRIDEIMFFARDEFTSKRTPLHPDMIARSDTARIYYGHGQQMPEDLGGDPANPDLTTPYARPRIDEPMSANPNTRLGQPSSLGVVNPNEFASNWSLLRHATLLVPRPSGVQDLPDEVLGLRPNENDNHYYRVADSSRQVALGPAAQSVFRATSALVPYEEYPLTASGQIFQNDPSGRNIRPLNGYTALQSNDETRARPLFTSGVIDVAVATLDEIRATVTNPWARPNLGSTAVQEFGPRTWMPHDFSSNTDRYGFDASRVYYGLEGITRVGTPLFQLPLDPYGNGSRRQTQQEWMLEALPSVAYDPVGGAPDLTGHRVRFEDIPPRVFFETGTLENDPELRRQAAIEQADQEMLASSVFVPRCTEFIVEFSFGIVDRRTSVTGFATNPAYGQQIWHGLRREANGRVIVDDFWNRWDDQTLTDIADPSQQDNFGIRGALPADAFEDGNLPSDNTLGAIDPEIFDLIRYQNRFAPDGNPADDVIAEYCFGYIYRDFNQDTADADTLAAGDADDTDRTWPWPTTVRVTMRFVDPGDLEREQTFQFEFRVPGLRGRL